MRQILALGIMVVLMGVGLATDRVYFEFYRQGMARFEFGPLYVLTPALLCLNAGLVVALVWATLSKAREHIPAAVVLLFAGTACMAASSVPGVITLNRMAREMPFRVRMEWLTASGLAASPHAGAIIAATGLATIVWALMQRSQDRGTTDSSMPAADDATE